MMPSCTQLFHASAVQGPPAEQYCPSPLSPAALTQPEVLELVRHPPQPHRAQDVVQTAPLVLPAQRPQLGARLGVVGGWVEGWRGGL